ncbi:hypothetical protein [Natrinema salsiterrestre]|uniref:hypothetical protein n=1 Tax=Natrinema salsiterrestre TaxID=2950540 RepID=UPI002405BCD7|nr:hypothetical protein [Natrinema salsiterrestre]
MVGPNSEPYAKEAEELVLKLIDKGMVSESVEERVAAHLADDDPVQALREALEHR